MVKFILRHAAVTVLLLFSVCPAPSLRASAEGDDLRAADAELNTIYQKTLDSLSNAATKEKLRASQRAWVVFRDAEVDLNSLLPGASGNTLKMLQTDLTEARTKQLKDITEAARGSTP